jgi:hypothetical protein
MKLSKSDFRTLLSGDFCAFIQRTFCELNPTTKFVPAWHLEEIASKLEACQRKEITRLIINVPPRYLKSCCASVAFVAFLLGRDPTEQIICASYGQELANKHAADCRRVMNSNWYRNLFPRTRLSSDRQAVQELTTRRRPNRPRS